MSARVSQLIQTQKEMTAALWQQDIDTLALLIGVGLAAGPTLPVLAAWIPPRVSRERERRALRKLKAADALYWTARKLKEAARAAGTVPLREAAAQLVAAGETTLEELTRVTFVA